MAHPLFWPGKYYFYPIGNTPAISLTRDLAPEEPANILLLGCGDPRNVLYTIFCEPQIRRPKLDFTCCDFDPAILARNILLLTLLADKKPFMTSVWNIFFHLKLDNASHSMLMEQCGKLIGISESLQTWRASEYASFIKFSTEYTVSEVRRHWKLYFGMEDSQRQNIINEIVQEAIAQQAKSMIVSYSSARSSGPLFARSLPIYTEQFCNYWKTGVTHSDPKKIAESNLPNPTFVYSLAGDIFSVQKVTDPLVSFHLAPLFGNATHAISVDDAVKAAKVQFRNWCLAFYEAISSHSSKRPIIRFCLGEATAVCHALLDFAATKTSGSRILVGQWTKKAIELSRDEYETDNAPIVFNVIDTSNLDDHIGLLNILIATVPLLSISLQSAVLYTESLLFRKGNPTKEIRKHLYGDITTLSILLNLVPVDFVSGFTTRSNFHELVMHRATGTELSNATQFHQVMTWKSPNSGDRILSQGGRAPPPAFEPLQLAALLYKTYQLMFMREHPSNLLKLKPEKLMRTISSSDLVHHIHETFVLFIRLVRDRLDIADDDWLAVMDGFFKLRDGDQSLPLDHLNYQDLRTHLYRQGLQNLPTDHHNLPRCGRFSSWNTVPALVRVLLVVPRSKLTVLDRSEHVRTPLLHCEIRGRGSQNIFTSVHASFGKVISTSTKPDPRVIFEEDAMQWRGSSPLVVSFVAPSSLFVALHPRGDLLVTLSLWNTIGGVHFAKELGLDLDIFSAKWTDESHVHILRELEQSSPPTKLRGLTDQTQNLLAEFGKPHRVVVELDEERLRVTSLTCRVSVQDKTAAKLITAGTVPSLKQISPCVMRITLDSRKQDVAYPFPVIGSKARLRTELGYVEIVVPVSGPFKSEGMKLNLFPVVGTNRRFSSWNIHHLNLSRLPFVDIKTRELGWLNQNISSQISLQERSNKEKYQKNPLTLIKDSLHCILSRSAGCQNEPVRRLFALRDKPSTECDTLFFISGLRFDLQSHTVVGDGAVLPLTPRLMSKIRAPFGKLVQEGNIFNMGVYEGEMRAWKQLLPAFVERCRSTWTHGVNCEYESKGRIPLTEEMHLDPLCSCGKGKDVEGMSEVALWEAFAPYVTRVAISPLFAVSYLEAILGDRCSACDKQGELPKCSGCQKVCYCSRVCQKNDWKNHKALCKA